MTVATEPQWDTDRTWTAPNILSFLRLLSVLVFGALIVLGHDLAAVILLALFGATDWLDGFLARKLQQRTELGAKLDPIADRLYIVTALVALLIRGIVPWWFLVILVSRDVVLFVLLLVTRRGDYRPVQVNHFGKAATFALLIAFPVMLIGYSNEFDLPVFSTVGWVLAIAGAVFHWTAGALYIGQAARTLRDGSRAELDPPPAR
ncbi:CDP-alcohol phosphatidyltransferase family protein [Enemella sp. A6]|uniref:CDP-alcohol phosphatidyltransferase family protein n=1 Tax=Enemella sp. A6 TaxID=3440152 RepID=UPI003EBE4263